MRPTVRRDLRQRPRRGHEATRSRSPCSYRCSRSSRPSERQA
jgi:hypothetical protein